MARFELKLVLGFLLTLCVFSVISADTSLNNYKGKYGDIHWIQWNAAPFPDKGIIYGFAIDITEQKNSNEKIKQFNLELDAFAYSVSHDLRVPLRSITGFALILLEDYADVLDDERRRITGIVINSAIKMGRLVAGAGRSEDYFKGQWNWDIQGSPAFCIRYVLSRN